MAEDTYRLILPISPYTLLDPNKRWVPREGTEPAEVTKLIPPLVHKLRRRIQGWRKKHYEGASETSKTLLEYWFGRREQRKWEKKHYGGFLYYFAQQEAVETIIYLYDVLKFQDSCDLLRFDSSGRLSTGMFPENWRRLVVKMATGTGKTKVMSLVLAWSYFHKLYEEDSDLARNFLIITPNIIVLDRIRSDFEGLKIFNQDPILPMDGHNGRNWESDFRLDVHIQDNVRVVEQAGNLFLTNIHRVYSKRDVIASIKDADTSGYFAGKKGVARTQEGGIDLGDIVRDVDELVVINDEAHHIHDEKLAWFQSLEDIHGNLKKKGKGLSLQIDVTATPKDSKGVLFPQIISDYPLVEAVHQGIVKSPVIPNKASRGKLKEYKTYKFTEKYKDYIRLGVEEWRKAALKHATLLGNKAILFIMTDDTRNCDYVAEYLERQYLEFQSKNSVLVIHTNNNGDFKEDTKGKGAEELKELRKQANEIDREDNPHKAIVSVMMLKEGWDVRNVTTIVGLRPYKAKSKILPEQTLGRGLRRMYKDKECYEKLSVIGTETFMEFVEQIEQEGVRF